MTENQDDQELINRISNGDKNAFKSLLEKYHKQVYGMSVRILGDRVMAEDIAQDTWIKVSKACDNYSPVGSVRSWILKICRNLCIDEIRRQNKWSEFPTTEDQKEFEDTLADSTDGAEQILSNQEELYRLTKSLNLLPADQRALLMMSLAEELSYSEISAQLGISISNIKVTLFRVRKSLRQLMEET